MGGRLAVAQPLAFPCPYNIEGDTADEVPESIKDWVALEAYKLSLPDARFVGADTDHRNHSVFPAGAQPG